MAITLEQAKALKIGTKVQITYHPITSDPFTRTEVAVVRKVWQQTFSPFAWQVWTAAPRKRQHTIHSLDSIERIEPIRKGS